MIGVFFILRIMSNSFLTFNNSIKMDAKGDIIAAPINYFKSFNSLKRELKFLIR